MVMNGINPARLIRFLFSTFEPQGPRDRRVYPTPNTLTSAPLRQKYDDYVANELPKKFEADLDSQARTASLKFRELLRSKSMQYTDEQALRLVLSDLALPLSALYRYCAAADSRHRLQDIRDQFMEPAAVQYLFERDLYDQFWAKYIPVSFVEMVDGVKNSIVGERIRNE